MKYSKIIICFLLLGFTFNANATNLKRKKKMPITNSYNYTKAFAELDSLTYKVDQPKNAQLKLDEIKANAKKENKDAYYIKCVQYQCTLNSKNAEDDDTSNVNWNLLITEIANGSNDVKAFLGINAAQYLKNIYSQNQYNSERNTDDKSTNPNNWSNEKLFNEINKLIDNTTQYAANVRYNDGAWEPIIENLKTKDIDLSIQQILGLQAIEILNNLELPSNTDYTQPNENDACATLDNFLKINFTSTNDAKNEYKILRIYQTLLGSGSISSIIYIDLLRIQYANSIKYNEDLKLKAYEALQTKYIENPYSNLVAKELAAHYQTKEPTKSMAIINQAIKKHPDFKFNNNLNAIKKEIEKPTLAIQLEKINQPNKKSLAKIDYKNLYKVYITAYKIDYIDYLKKTSYNYQLQKTEFTINDYILSLKVTSTYAITLPKYNDYKLHSAEIALNALAEGTYIILANNTETLTDDAIAAHGIVHISPYNIVKNNKTYTLVNALDGKPVANEDFKIIDNQYHYNTSGTGFNTLIEGKTDSKGNLNLSKLSGNAQNESVIIEIDNGVLYSNEYLSEDYKAEKEYESINGVIFTDRSIYRPGQTVYFKCISYNETTKKTIANDKLQIILLDNNEEIKGELNLITNTYGSASGSFVLPKGGFNSGRFSISVNTFYDVYFNVEEYKRPKYKAEFLTPEKAYKLNDDISIIGEAKAYAGYGVQDAKVEYNVVRKLKPRYYWYNWNYNHGYNNSQEVVITTGNTATDKEGKFTINFKALPDANQDPKTNPYFIYEINATITDINGEVKTCNYSLNLAYTDKQVSISDNGKNWQNEAVKLNYSCTNLQDKPLPFSGTISIEKIEENTSVLRNRLWEKCDTTNISANEYNTQFNSYENIYIQNQPKNKTILTQTFTNDTKTEWIIPANNLKDLGSYLATITATDSRGETITESTQFTIEPKQEGAYNLPNALQMQVVNGNSFEPKQTAKLLISSGIKNALITLKIESQRGVILEKEITLTESSQLIDIPVTAADRGNIVAHAYLTYNYRFYTNSETANVPYSNKELSLKIKSYRNQTEPGAKEKWIVTLKGPAAEKAAMETLATLYDQSLDELNADNYWGLNVFSDFYSYNNVNSNYENLHLNQLNYRYDYVQYEPFLIPTYNWNFGSLSRYFSLGYSKAGGRRRLVDARAMVADGSIETLKAGAMEITITESQSWVGKKNDGNFNIEYNVIDKSSNQPNPIPQPKIRKNFNETAFFFPHLYANKNGEITLEFTMPEALTQWKLKMLAHSSTLQSGALQQSITTSKKVMVQPNMPRFLRQGDNITIASKVVNTTNEAITALVNFTITNEETGKPLTWLTDKATKTITVPANSSTPVSFSLNIPNYTGVATIAITTTAGTFSDGEQHTLPVLSNRTLITESMLITVRKSGTQNLEFKHLKENNSTTLVNEKLSVEMSSNPAWYAIQALPYMMEFPHECAEQTFTRLYANSIAVNMAKSNPEIKKVYDAWVRQAENGKGLQSKLAQNQDLKTTLIEETPWLMEANNETERMQKMGTLFNQAKMNEELQTAFEKLKQMQMENGAFPWFGGMYANVYITQTIVIGFGKMQKMGVDISQYQEMIDKAMNYLDAEATREYSYFKTLKEFKNFYPSNLQYLYCKSYFPKSGIETSSEVVQYYLNNAEKTWVENSLMNRAQLATALLVLKPKSEVPQLIIKSFTENAKQTDEMGMYWAANKSGYYWHEAPVETQAAIIEAYNTIGKNTEAIKEQQIWLLRQKQTQNWQTTRSTADACYALIMNNNLLNSKQQVTVAVNNVSIKPQATQEGTGYYRENIAKESITNNSGNIAVTATTNDFAYGAIYWQYFEDLNKIQSVSAGLKITKKIFKIENTPTGIKKVEVQANETLNVGDMIELSLDISSDRNLEFVHIKDLRAAGTEPVDVLSAYKWQSNLGYYQVTKDASTNFFIDNLAKGIYQINYTLKVEQAGTFDSGLATAQCMYAPEFVANSKGVVLKVE